MVRGVHRKSRRHRNIRARTRFSWLRFGTPTKVVSESRKYSIWTHFQKKRNCEVCLRTKMTKAACRRRTGDAVPRATEVGDLITAGESRNNHRYAVVVQDPATQWIQSYPCKNKTSQETDRSLRKFLGPSEQLKVIYCDNSWNLAHSVKIYHGITEHQHLLDLRRTVLLKELHAE